MLPNVSEQWLYLFCPVCGYGERASQGSGGSSVIDYQFSFEIDI